MSLDAWQARKAGAAYVHIPFCVSKCNYCDFNSYPGLGSLFDDYVRALILEIERAPAGMASDGELDSVYFGGGTPTVLPPPALASILDAIRSRLGVAPDAEITTEANPGTVDISKFVELYAAGFNRLSLGVQSFDDEMLAALGRVHTARQAMDAFEAAREAGFANVGIDLMFALSGQTLRHWDQTLSAAIELSPEHISLYELSIEEGTRFEALRSLGRLDLPDEDTQLEMYELAIARLKAAGFEHYEVSNFARPGFRSRHNQVYWRNDPHFAFGAGATSYLMGERSRRPSDPNAYVQAIAAGVEAVESSERLEGRALLAETLIQGLRMLDGVDLAALSEDTGTDIAAEFAGEIGSLESEGLVRVESTQLAATHRGLLLLNDVSQAFLS